MENNQDNLKYSDLSKEELIDAIIYLKNRLVNSADILEIRLDAIREDLDHMKEFLSMFEKLEDENNG